MKGKTQEKMERGSRKRSSSAGSEKMERVGGREKKKKWKDIFRQTKAHSGLQRQWKKKKFTNSSFIMSLLYASTCFERYVLIIRRSKLCYTTPGIITPVGGRPVHRLRGVHCSQPVHRTATYKCDGIRCLIIQFWPPDGARNM